MEKPEFQFEEAFMLSSCESSAVGNHDELVEVEIIDVIEEWGYDGPPEDENRAYYSNVQYMLRVQAKGVEKHFSFYSSDIAQKDNFCLDLEDYKIHILSDTYSNSFALIEMIINKKGHK